MSKCVKFFENREIDKIPDIKKNIEREKIYDNFDREEKYLIKIEFDNDDEDEDEDENYENTQFGGTQSPQKIEINYLTYKMKFLELKCLTSYLFTELKL